jgi:alanine racemase
MHTSWLQIDLQALDGNVRTWRDSLGPGTRLGAVVKADAYGLGAAALVRQLDRSGIDLLAVYSPAQALDVLAQRPRCPVLIFMPARELSASADLREAAHAGRLHFSLHSREGLAVLADLARGTPQPLAVHVYLDTGMSRAGFHAQELTQVIAQLDDHPTLRLAGLYSHLSSGDDDPESVRWQHERFVAACAPWANRPGVWRHLANTFGALRGGQYRLDLVRVGLGMHGYGPTLMTGAGVMNLSGQLRPILSWHSRIAHVGRFAAGAPVGYNQTHRLTRDSTLALVPVGYADGYPLSLSGKGVVGLCEDAGRTIAHAPVLGRVNMDQVVLDVTDLPGTHVGQPVELLSADPQSPCSLPRLAQLAGSHCYELMCRLSHRLPRRYIESR